MGLLAVAALATGESLDNKKFGKPGCHSKYVAFANVVVISLGVGAFNAS
jgi:hypothetical protein